MSRTMQRSCGKSDGSSRTAQAGNFLSHLRRSVVNICLRCRLLGCGNTNHRYCCDSCGTRSCFDPGSVVRFALATSRRKFSAAIGSLDSRIGNLAPCEAQSLGEYYQSPRLGKVTHRVSEIIELSDRVKRELTSAIAATTTELDEKRAQLANWCTAALMNWTMWYSIPKQPVCDQIPAMSSSRLVQ